MSALWWISVNFGLFFCLKFSIYIQTLPISRTLNCNCDRKKFQSGVVVPSNEPGSTGLEARKVTFNNNNNNNKYFIVMKSWKSFCTVSDIHTCNRTYIHSEDNTDRHIFTCNHITDTYKEQDIHASWKHTDTTLTYTTHGVHNRQTHTALTYNTHITELLTSDTCAQTIYEPNTRRYKWYIF